MSIFKQSFSDFVRKQLSLREAIIAQGNAIRGGVIDSKNSLSKLKAETLGKLGLPSAKQDIISVPPEIDDS